MTPAEHFAGAVAVAQAVEKPVDVLQELALMRMRFVNCAKHSGSDAEFANGACERFDKAVAVVAGLLSGDALAQLIESVQGMQAASRHMYANPNEAAITAAFAARERLNLAMARAGAK